MLHPEIPKEGEARKPRPGETEDELAEPLRSAARDAGLIMRPPPVRCNTMYALEATEYAQQRGKFLEFHRAAYRALWEDGKDLGDLAVIEEIGRDVGLNSADLLASLEKKFYEPVVLGQYQEALRHGVNGIPTFVVGNLLFTGAHPYSIFRSAMNQVLQTK